MNFACKYIYKLCLAITIIKRKTKNWICHVRYNEESHRPKLFYRRLSVVSALGILTKLETYVKALGQKRDPILKNVVS